MPGASACAQQHRGDVYSNEVLVHDGHLQNVLVRIVRGHESLPKGEVPAAPVVLDQRGCMYTPRLAAARVGQEVIFVNSDPLFHNVRSFSSQNPEFNLAMPIKNQRISRRFDKPDLFMRAKCSVHPWMGAYIAVIDHPYFAVTDANGAFEINHLPPGDYTLEFWHEYYGTVSQDISVKENNLPLNITLRK
jgi:plastocyanin